MKSRGKRPQARSLSRSAHFSMSVSPDASSSPVATSATTTTTTPAGGAAVQPIWIDSATKLLLRRLADDATLLSAVLFNTPTVGCHHVQRHVQQRGPRLLEEAIQLARRKHTEYEGLHKDVSFAADFAAATNGAARRSVQSIGQLSKQALENYRRNRSAAAGGGGGATTTVATTAAAAVVTPRESVASAVVAADSVEPAVVEQDAATEVENEAAATPPEGIAPAGGAAVTEGGGDVSSTAPLQDAAVTGFSSLTEPAEAGDDMVENDTSDAAESTSIPSQ